MQNLFTDAPSVLIKNADDEEIPARSFVQIIGRSRLASGREVLLGRKPTYGSDGVYVVSGHLPIAVGKVKGGFIPNAPVWVEYSGSVEAVEEFGPVAGQWRGSNNGAGYWAIGTDGGKALIIGAQSQSSSSSGGSSPCECQPYKKGMTLEGDQTVCCVSHDQFYAEEIEKVFYWQGDDTWSTYNADPTLDNPLSVLCCPQTTTSGSTTTAGATTTCEWVEDLYDLVLTASETASTIVLVPRGTEQCCEKDATYKFGKFRCQGSMRFELDSWCNIEELGLPRCLCIDPYTARDRVDGGEVTDCLSFEVPVEWLVEVSGFTGTVWEGNYTDYGAGVTSCGGYLAYLSYDSPVPSTAACDANIFGEGNFVLRYNINADYIAKRFIHSSGAGLCDPYTTGLYYTPKSRCWGEEAECYSAVPGTKLSACATWFGNATVTGTAGSGQVCIHTDQSTPTTKPGGVRVNLFHDGAGEFKLEAVVYALVEANHEYYVTGAPAGDTFLATDVGFPYAVASYSLVKDFGAIPTAAAFRAWIVAVHSLDLCWNVGPYTPDAQCSSEGQTPSFPATLAITAGPVAGEEEDFPESSGYCGETCEDCISEVNPPPTTEEVPTTPDCTDDPVGYCCISGICSPNSCSNCVQADGEWWGGDNTCGGECTVLTTEEATTTVSPTTTSGSTTTPLGTSGDTTTSGATTTPGGTSGP